MRVGMFLSETYVGIAICNTNMATLIKNQNPWWNSWWRSWRGEMHPKTNFRLLTTFNDHILFQSLLGMSLNVSTLFLEWGAPNSNVSAPHFSSKNKHTVPVIFLPCAALESQILKGWFLRLPVVFSLTSLYKYLMVMVNDRKFEGYLQIEAN